MFASSFFYVIFIFPLSASGKLVVWGPVVWDSNWNPFHKGISGIQTHRDPNHQLSPSVNFKKQHDVLLYIQIPPQVRCFRHMLRVQIPNLSRCLDV